MMNRRSFFSFLTGAGAGVVAGAVAQPDPLPAKAPVAVSMESLGSIQGEALRPAGCDAAIRVHGYTLYYEKGLLVGWLRTEPQVQQAQAQKMDIRILG